MVTGWRRVFCTSIPKDRETTVLTEKQHHHQHCKNDNTTNQIPRISSKFRFFSNPSTPRSQTLPPVSSPSLRCRTTTNTPTSSLPNSPKLQCKTTTTTPNSGPRLFHHFSNPSSPKSPSNFSLLKASLRLSKSRCGICLQTVKTGQGTAIFTAECSHAFHFPCVATHAKKQQLLACPVCSTSWKEVPLLSVHHNNNPKPKSESESKLPQSKTKSLRVYNDDEPLMSPIALAQFNPIPESEEKDDEEQENQEFQGFFVNPSPLTTKLNHHHQIATNVDVEVNLLHEAAVVAVGRRYETYVVVLKVRAPPSPAAHVPRKIRVDLVTVLDVSGGTSGVKMQMMKRTMRSVISSLCETDRLSIIAFSASSKRLLPLRRMTTNGRRAVRRIVDAIAGTGQGMSVYDALKKAVKVIEDRREKNPIASIMLLSDGQDDWAHAIASNKKRSSPLVSTKRFSHLDIPVHVVGFGCGGAYDHGTQGHVFAKCLSGLLSVVVQDLRLQLGFVSGSGPAEIASVYCTAGRSESVGSGSVRLGDLYGEEERELLVELRVPASSVGSHHVLSVRSSHWDPSSQEVIYSTDHALLIPRLKAERSSSPTIKRHRNLHVSTRAIAESWRLIERNDLTGALHLLSSARALLIQSSSSSADEYLSGLDSALSELNRRREHQVQSQRQRCGGQAEEKTEQLTPTSAWRAAERLAKVAIMRKHMNRVSDLHGFENARF